MSRYLEDVRRLKAMQTAERDSYAEKDINVLVHRQCILLK